MLSCGVCGERSDAETVFHPSTSCGGQWCFRGGRYTKTVSSRLEDHKPVVTVVADISWRCTNMQTIVIKICNNVPDVRWVITFRYVGTPYSYPLVLSPHRIILNYRPGNCFGLKKCLFVSLNVYLLPHLLLTTHLHLAPRLKKE